MARHWATAIAAVILSVAPAMGQAGQTPAVTISVYNDVQVPELVLARSEERAGHVLRQAGVNVQWANRTGPSPTGKGCNQISDEFVCIAMHVVGQPVHANGDVFGMAFVAPDGIGRYSDIFYGRIEALADRTAVPDILGHVMAHEIGHLLLGVQAHSKLGIMQPRWGADQLRKAIMGNLLFTPEQARRMQSRLGEVSQSERPVYSGQ